MIPSVVPQPPAPHRASWDCWLTPASTANRVSSLHCVPCHCLTLLNGVFMCDSVSPPTIVHARRTPCTFSIILRKSREHLEQLTAPRSQSNTTRATTCGKELTNLLNPFQKICPPMQTTRNEERALLPAV